MLNILNSTDLTSVEYVCPPSYCQKHYKCTWLWLLLPVTYISQCYYLYGLWSLATIQTTIEYKHGINYCGLDKIPLHITRNSTKSD